MVNADLSTTQWVVNGYALALGLFSLLGWLAPDIELLIAARVAMGVGAALMWPAILGESTLGAGMMLLGFLGLLTAAL